ncbi:protein-glutamate O-methyltransferase family protein [Nostoc sp. UCD121]|uniref:damage-control phosphatase ARMT1 family protein n=1 Tax=unclassified Nostoc TaxID=2593658 RepID=UPI0016242637|nr:MULTISPECIES: damage-control phosphatase ARMT1 family protein [unclassified Nostoc]MBC1224995.1 protein-glutamate O-methyltransferase family protein [Nostoc sp. UCD120]MBC1279961.1 protein-glutamate O-methyltransferase family protein [Nostoc sp. UCD121]MBC1294619.1 protein-glutamate O-methyltransferase family protein [Nostoc sp. UCD122]
MVKLYKAPKLSLPPSLFGSEVGSFTELTVTQRMPAIARRVIVENNFPSEINTRLERLATELPTGYLQPLANDTGVDFPAWDTYLRAYKGQRWIDVPWFFAETYFYRLILEITDYFRPGIWQGVDPFQLQKSQGLEASLDSATLLSTQVNKWLEDFEIDVQLNQKALIALLYFALWGNRVDLSLWSAFEDDRSRFDIQNQIAHILVNDASQISELLTISEAVRVDFVLDNAGFELVCDLCLVDFLLSSNLVNQVYLHLKPHPTFVSDAMIKDVHDTTSFLATTQMTSFAQRLETHIASGRLVLSEAYFWTSPLPFWEIPSSLKNELTNASLVIVKGDANYRRLLGDRHWDITASFADIVCYLPAPIVALRTLKSEVAVGLKSEVIKKVANSDHSWLTNGQWGVIQFVA